ncbi:MAG: DUF3858 domain-containing protein, partial [Pedobacter sp.]
VYINRGYSDEDVITYIIPDNFNIELKPNDLMIESPFGSYSTSLKLEGKKLVYNRKLIVNSGTYPADTYQKFADLLNAASGNDQGKIVFKTN